MARQRRIVGEHDCTDVGPSTDREGPVEIDVVTGAEAVPAAVDVAGEVLEELDGPRGGTKGPGSRGEPQREFEAVAARHRARARFELGEAVGDEVPCRAQRVVVIEVRSDACQRLLLALFGRHRPEPARRLAIAIPRRDGGVDCVPAGPRSEHGANVPKTRSGLTDNESWP